MAKTGLKVCKEAARQIRLVVHSEILNNGHVDPVLVQNILRKFAEGDARLHQNDDRGFHLGNGPAVENRGH